MTEKEFQVYQKESLKKDLESIDATQVKCALVKSSNFDEISQDYVDSNAILKIGFNREEYNKFIKNTLSVFESIHSILILMIDGSWYEMDAYEVEEDNWCITIKLCTPPHIPLECM